MLNLSWCSVLACKTSLLFSIKDAIKLNSSVDCFLSACIKMIRFVRFL